MKHNTELGSRIATVHNGSALFTGDAGGGESEIRKHIIENDWLECIIALPKNIFYNTGIPTYVWIVSNRKAENRKGKVQLINALDLYVKLRKNLGQKNCELKDRHIEQITQLYTDFKETDISKIYPNDYFGYNKITVERPLRLSSKFTNEAIETLRFENGISEEMQWAYEKFGDDVYFKLKDLKPQIENYLTKNEIKLTNPNKKKLFSQEFWKNQLNLLNDAKKLQMKIGTKQFDDFNVFKILVTKIIKELKLKLDAKAQKSILNAVSRKNEDAEQVIKKKEKDGTIVYESDSDLRDTENVPLDEDIQSYFEREVLQHIPFAWIDHSKTVKGYEISFTRYFYNYVPPRSIEKITAEILQLEKETEGILNQIVKD
jgi:type I restriction enzyme M protein